MMRPKLHKMNHALLISFAVAATLGLSSCQSIGQGGMSVNHQTWGTTKSGDKVTLYTLRNSRGMEVRIADHGATIVSLTAPDRDGKFADVVLGFDTLQDYETRNPFFGCIAGRYANRIGKGRFMLDGKEYALAVNNGPNHLHGGKVGFDKRVWKSREISRSNGVGVEMTYSSPNMEEGYPGKLDSKVIYVLTNDNSLEVEYTATTDAPTVVNLTNHSYFNLAGEGSGQITNHVVSINADSFTPTDSGLIPTGQIAAVEGTPLDFRSPQRIGARIGSSYPAIRYGEGYDHNFVLNGGTGMKTAARAKDPASGRVLEVLTTEPGVQFYTGNHQKKLVGCKNGHTYDFRTGFCFETQHYPDSPNRPEFPSTVLRPGDTYQHSTIFKFRAE
jgi:aldose 1-epimerase